MKHKHIVFLLSIILMGASSSKGFTASEALRQRVRGQGVGRGQGRNSLWQTYWPQVATSFLPRSQSRDNARKISGMEQHMYTPCLTPWWGSLTITPEYTQSFNPTGIAECLFGPDLITCNGCNTILIQGSEIQNRPTNAWLADYFYLPPDYNGNFSVNPRIINFDITPFLHLNLDEWLCNGYFNMWGTFVWAQWNLNFCECIENSGTSSYVAGYFNADGIDRAALLDNFGAYVTGSEVIGVENLVSFPLSFTRMTCDAQTRVGFADLRWELGWNFHFTEDQTSRFGINFQGAAPTGNKLNSLLLFNPVIGNGKHWELGVGISAHHIFWRSQDCSCSFGMYVDIAVTHLFGSRAIRTFDLCKRPNSRYALAALVEPGVLDGLAGRTTAGFGAVATPPNAQFKSTVTPVANLTTLDIKITIAAQADAAVLLNYQHCNWDFDLGYNFWSRSKEKFSCLQPCTLARCFPSLCDPSQQDRWVLKGDARMFGFAAIQAGDLNAMQPVALSPSQDLSTINTGNNLVLAQAQMSPADPLYARNDGVDNAEFAVAGTDGTARLVFSPTAADNDENQIKTSINPVYLTCTDLDFVSTHGTTHKIFANISYSFDTCSKEWEPYLGIGGFAEFARNSRPDTPADSLDPTENPFQSMNCALSQWGIWLKGGVGFYTV